MFALQGMYWSRDTTYVRVLAISRTTDVLRGAAVTLAMRGFAAQMKPRDLEALVKIDVEQMWRGGWSPNDTWVYLDDLQTRGISFVLYEAPVIDEDFA